MNFSELEDQVLKDSVVESLRALTVATAAFWDELRDCEHKYGKSIEYSDGLVGMLAGDLGSSLDERKLTDEKLLRALDGACKIEE
jgi:hypothetical protein